MRLWNRSWRRRWRNWYSWTHNSRNRVCGALWCEMVYEWERGIKRNDIWPKPLPVVWQRTTICLHSQQVSRHTLRFSVDTASSGQIHVDGSQWRHNPSWILLQLYTDRRFSPYRSPKGFEMLCYLNHLTWKLVDPILWGSFYKGLLTKGCLRLCLEALNRFKLNRCTLLLQSMLLSGVQRNYCHHLSSFRFDDTFYI